MYDKYCFCLYALRWGYLSREVSAERLKLAKLRRIAKTVFVIHTSYYWMGTNMAAGNQQKHLSLSFATKA